MDRLDPIKAYIYNFTHARATMGVYKWHVP